MGSAVWDSGAFSKPIVMVPEHERTAYCGLCQFKFEDGDNVDEHMQLHMGTKPDGTPVIVPGPLAQVSDLQRMLGDLRRED